ncbi:MAG: MOSC domain-containing protein [Aureispira sp.]|nr:MOSC domain-containing protein [Aureispira sp.]
MKKAKVVSLSKSDTHSMSKFVWEEIMLLKGLGVEGDAHLGKTVKHRSRVAKDPSQPNLRQVHLIHQELHEELKQKGFGIKAGEMGENITTKGIDLLSLPKDTVLHIGALAKIRITGLRNPCHQLDGLAKGLMKAVLDRAEDGTLIRKAGVMAVVEEGGLVRIADEIIVELPQKPYIKLDRV